MRNLIEKEGCSWVTHTCIHGCIHTGIFLAQMHAQCISACTQLSSYKNLILCVCCYVWGHFLKLINMLFFDSVTDESLWLPATVAPSTLWSQHTHTWHDVWSRALALTLAIISILVMAILLALGLDLSMQIRWAELAVNRKGSTVVFCTVCLRLQK